MSKSKENSSRCKSWCKRITWFIIASLIPIAITVGFYVTRVKDVPVPQEYLEDHYWGFERITDVAKMPDVGQRVPYKISFSDHDIRDLKSRLSNSRITPSLPGTKFHYGFRSESLEKLISYWNKEYDWKKQENDINSMGNHYHRQIEGINVHFAVVNVGVSFTKKTPLLAIHGWPGSFIEILPMIKSLKKDFVVIIPSIPGFGFSEAAHQPGLHAYHIARMLHKLMKAEGHERYLVHGGDWGSLIGKAISRMYPESVLGFHTTLPGGPMSPYSLTKVLLAEMGLGKIIYSDYQREYPRLHPLGQTILRLIQETGFMHIQATKPDTVGVALNNDPVGLAAYILEKFSGATNYSHVDLEDGGLTHSFTYDQLINNVMIYWLSSSITTSARIYKESLLLSLTDKFQVKVPVAALVAKHEVPHAPKSINKETYVNTIQYTDLDEGGHFLSYQLPEVVAKDIENFALKLQLIK